MGHFDRASMWVVGLDLFNSKDMYRLNLCRLCLQVECVSEICNCEGDHILAEVWVTTDRIIPALYYGPNQARPRPWNLWRAAIKHTHR
jgi:hypothetical protein